MFKRLLKRQNAIDVDGNVFVDSQEFMHGKHPSFALYQNRKAQVLSKDLRRAPGYFIVRNSQGKLASVHWTELKNYHGSNLRPIRKTESGLPRLTPLVKRNAGNDAISYMNVLGLTPNVVKPSMKRGINVNVKNTVKNARSAVPPLPLQRLISGPGTPNMTPRSPLNLYNMSSAPSTARSNMSRNGGNVNRRNGPRRVRFTSTIDPAIYKNPYYERPTALLRTSERSPTEENLDRHVAKTKGLFKKYREARKKRNLEKQLLMQQNRKPYLMRTSGRAPTLEQLKEYERNARRRMGLRLTEREAQILGNVLGELGDAMNNEISSNPSQRNAPTSWREGLPQYHNKSWVLFRDPIDGGKTKTAAVIKHDPATDEYTIKVFGSMYYDNAKKTHTDILQHVPREALMPLSAKQV